MAKKKNEKQLIIPNILGLETDIAGDILDDLGIKYEIQEKKIITLFRDKNCVAKTTPKKNKPINKDEVLKIYPSKCKLAPILILIIIALGVIVYFINKTSITPLFGGEPNIQLESNGWAESNIVYINEDAVFNYSKVDHYKYCINKTKSTGECDWKDTYTKSIRLSESGTWYVWFKGISEDNNESSTSNRLKVQIDNESPTIASIDKVVANKSIEVKVDAKDNLSGINKYYYSINNSEYIEDSKSHTFTSLDENTKYDINIKIEDKAGNITDANIKVSTSTNKKDDSTTTVNRIIPQVSMVDIPSYITYQDKYYLPISVTPNKMSEYITCYDENNNIIDNTNTLSIGEHKIRCTYQYDNLTINTYKNINVEIEQGKDEIFNEYVRLNLNYPTSSIKYMYRLNTDDVRLDEDKWNYYVDNLYIKKDMVNNLMIKYELDGKEHIITSKNDLYIDIRPDKYILNEGEETIVNLIYDNKEDHVYYSINGSSYHEYNNSFKVKGNTLINAYIVRTIKVYDEKTNSIIDKEFKAYDSIYVENIYNSIGDKNNTDVSISLENLPNTITTDKVFSIPSSYSYGIHGSNILTCSYDNKVINSTSDLKEGEYNITCTITALDGETKSVSKHIRIEKDNYKYDLDNIPSVITEGDNYELDNSCKLDNTKDLKVGKHTIKCGSVSKEIEVVKDDILHIDINNIPSTIEVGTLYELPSHIKGNNIKYIKCLDEDKNIIYNTSILSIGNHSITCSIKNDKEEKSITSTISVIKPKYIIDISK